MIGITKDPATGLCHGKNNSLSRIDFLFSRKTFWNDRIKHSCDKVPPSGLTPNAQKKAANLFLSCNELPLESNIYLWCILHIFVRYSGTVHSLSQQYSLQNNTIQYNSLLCLLLGVSCFQQVYFDFIYKDGRRQTNQQTSVRQQTDIKLRYNKLSETFCHKQNTIDKKLFAHSSVQCPICTHAVRPIIK